MNLLKIRLIQCDKLNSIDLIGFHSKTETIFQEFQMKMWLKLWNCIINKTLFMFIELSSVNEYAFWILIQMTHSIILYSND